MPPRPGGSGVVLSLLVLLAFGFINNSVASSPPSFLHAPAATAAALPTSSASSSSSRTCSSSLSSAVETTDKQQRMGNAGSKKGPSSSGGYDALRDPYVNKGLALSEAERDKLGVRGLLPAGQVALDVQIEAALKQIRERPTPIDKYLYLDSLRDANAQLFFALLVKHTDELLPIVYTPTVGQACLSFSHIFTPRPKGLFISLKDKGHVKEILQAWPAKDIKVIVFTDGERILGLGDLGANGMGIPLGKSALYTALGGVPPENALGVTIDVGTNNEENLADPAYIGLRQKRDRTQAYDELIKEFMEAAKSVFGEGVLLQWEDFGNSNAFRLLEDWEDKATTFNDDIQGTASVALAGLMAAMRLRGDGKTLADQTFLFLGAGEAAIGIADLIAYAIHRETGVSVEEGRKKIWLFDSKGLIVQGRDHVTPHKAKFAHPGEHLKTFAAAVKALKPTGIIGVSTIAKAFDKEVLETMAALNERPVVFALSNPTSKSECSFEEATNYTKGKVIFASGSPFPALTYDGRLRVPGQGNNAYIFPSLGLAVCIWGLRRIGTEEFYIASRTVAEMVSQEQLQKDCLYPPLTEVRDVSAAIAAAIAENEQKKGTLRVPVPPEGFLTYAKNMMYDPLK